jgi:predicted transcriptional regulator
VGAEKITKVRINQADERCLDYEEWFVGEVKHALKQVEAGEVLDHGEVVKRLERKREAKLGSRRR